MDRKSQSDLHQRRSRIASRAKLHQPGAPATHPELSAGYRRCRVGVGALMTRRLKCFLGGLHSSRQNEMGDILVLNFRK